jgi:hypothetical protein
MENTIYTNLTNINLVRFILIKISFNAIERIRYFLTTPLRIKNKYHTVLYFKIKIIKKTKP